MNVHKYTYTSAILLTFLLAAGCGKGGTKGNASATGGSSNATAGSGNAAAGSSRNDQITGVVAAFLEAVRRGDTNSANAQLTPLALKRMNENKMMISPPASETAKFTIGTVEVIEGDKAVVESVWTDLDVDGKPVDQHTTWALRLGNGQWRISGMAEDMGPEQDPMIIDFENPTALVRQQPSQTAEPARQASQPATNPFQDGVSR